MSFVMRTQNTKKVKFLDSEGRETYEDEDPFAFLRFQEAGMLRPAKKLKEETGTAAQNSGAAEPDQDDDEERADPEVAISFLQAAHSELTVVIDLIDNIAGLQTVQTQHVKDGRSKAQGSLEDKFQAETHTRELRAACSRLRAAAKQLRAEVERDNLFVRELGSLQGFWIVEPSTAGTPDSYTLKLAFARSLYWQSIDGGDGSGLRLPAPVHQEFRVIQGLRGNVVIGDNRDDDVASVQGAAAGSAVPGAQKIDVSVGAEAVHSTLLQCFQKLVWSGINQYCFWEISQAKSALFADQVVVHALKHLDGGWDSRLHLYRPIMKHFMIERMTPRVGSESVSKEPLRLTSELHAFLKSRYLRSLALRLLHSQVVHYARASMTLMDTGTSGQMCVLLDGGHLGTLMCSCRGGFNEEEFCVQAMPRGASPIHATPSLCEYTLSHVQICDLEALLGRYWGPPGDG